jgi:hypothetical protein
MRCTDDLGIGNKGNQPLNCHHRRRELGIRDVEVDVQTTATFLVNEDLLVVSHDLTRCRQIATGDVVMLQINVNANRVTALYT